MFTQRWLLGGVILAAISIALIYPTMKLSAGPPEEHVFPQGTAVRITIKGSSDSFFLSNLQTVRIADRGFLRGRKILGGASVYLPASEVLLIEEFQSVAEIKRTYRLGEPEIDPKKSPAEVNGKPK